MIVPVKLYGAHTRIIVRDVGRTEYIYGEYVQHWYEADITKALVARNDDEAEHIANMLSYVCSKAIRENGMAIDQGKSGPAQPLDGCSMVAFYEPGKGVESARVTLTHIESGRAVIGYNRTHDEALRQANAEMTKLLKKA